MNTRENYTREQRELVAEFAGLYGLDPEQIIFFGDERRPLFDRDAVAVLIQRLTTAVGVEDDLVPPMSEEGVAVKYRITFEDGTFASSTGVAYLNERAAEHEMSPEQIKSLATARAARGALVNKGIDLVKLHYQSQNGGFRTPEFTGPPQRNAHKLLREAHALGYETGLIVDTTYEAGGKKYTDKSGWQRVLSVRYGKERSSDLTEAKLADFVAFLRSQLPNRSRES